MTAAGRTMATKIMLQAKIESMLRMHTVVRIVHASRNGSTIVTHTVNEQGLAFAEERELPATLVGPADD